MERMKKMISGNMGKKVQAKTILSLTVLLITGLTAKLSGQVTTANAAPVVINQPETATLSLGDAPLSLDFGFTSPEEGQVTTITYSPTDIPGVNVVQNTPGAEAVLVLSVTPSVENKGTHTLTITATDNAAEPLSTTINYTFTVTSSLGATISSDTDTICFGGTARVTLKGQGGQAPYKISYYMGGTLHHQTTTGDIYTLTVKNNTSISIYSIEDNAGDKSDISGQVANITMMPEIAPAILSSREAFTRSECSGKYIHEPIRLQPETNYSEYQWEYLKGSEYQDAGTKSILEAKEPGTYRVRLSDVFGCQGQSSIELKEAEPVANEDTNLICNGKFEKNEELYHVPFPLLLKDSVLSCAGNQVTGGELDTDFYGFEFGTNSRYATFFGEGIPNTFQVNDSLWFRDSYGNEEVLYAAQNDSTLKPYGGRGNVLFLKGTAGNSCDVAPVSEWAQEVALTPNTNYELKFLVARIGDTGTGKTSPNLIDIGFKNGTAFTSFIGNSYFLNDPEIKLQEIYVDTSTVLRPYPVGDSTIYTEEFRKIVKTSKIEVLGSNIPLQGCRKNGYQVWYAVSLKFSSKELSNTTLAILNRSMGAKYNIIALDNISLLESNSLPGMGISTRVLIDRTATTTCSINDDDMQDNIVISPFDYSPIPTYKETRLAPNLIGQEFTWKPEEFQTVNINVPVYDGHENVIIEHKIQACWDYDLTIKGVKISKTNNIYAGTDTIDIECYVQNDFLYEESKKATKKSTNFVVQFFGQKNDGTSVIKNLYGKAIDILPSGDTVNIKTSVVFPKEEFGIGGDFYLRLMVDPQNLVECENDEANNRVVKSLNLVKQFTDLSIENFTISTTEMLPGFTKFNYSFDVKNIGTIPRSAIVGENVSAKLYIKGSNGQKLLLPQHSVALPAAGKTAKVSKEETTPQALFIADSYSLLVVVDEEETVSTDGNRANNEYEIPIRILEKIEYQRLKSIYVHPATDTLNIGFLVKDNNYEERLTVTYSGQIFDSYGAEFKQKTDKNTVDCEIKWVPQQEHIREHEITITAKDESGYESSREITLKITDTPPKIDSVGPHPDTITVMTPFAFGLRATDRTLGDSVSFYIKGKAFDEYDAQIVQKRFGNNAMAEFQWRPDFSAKGLFPMTIVASDKNGLEDSIKFNLFVKSLPNATFNFVSRCEQNGVVFKAAGDGAKYSWEFGDGKTLETNKREITHSYEAPGKYQVTLTAFKDGVSNSTSSYVTVGTPKAFFATKDVCFGEVSTFSNVTEGATSYEWDFGDGGTSSKAYDINPVHMYTTTKDTAFLCTLTVSVGGCSDSYTQKIHVSEGVKAAITATDGGNLVCEGTEVFFDASGSEGAVTYLWNFSDTSAHSQNRSRDIETSHTFNHGGSYQVSLTTTNGRCKAEAVHFVTVEPRPQLSIEGPTHICSGSGAVLSGKIANASQSNFFDYIWLDGRDTVIGRNRTLMTGDAGVYRLLIGNSCGSSDTAEFTLYEIFEPLAEAGLISGITCNGANDGKALITIHQQDTAEAPYLIEWGSNKTTTPDTLIEIDRLKEGRNYISITNAVGCKATVSVEVTNSGPSMFAEAKPSGCEENSGVISGTITGGAAPYTVTLSGPREGSVEIEDTIFDINKLERGRYNVVVTDNYGCSMEVKNLLISSPAISIDVPVEESCGAGDVEITAKATLSNPDTSDHTEPAFVYTWFRYDSAATKYKPAGSGASGLFPSGSYLLTVKENNFGCTDTSKFTIKQGAGLSAKITGASPLCYGDSTGSLKVDVSGNSGMVDYLWTAKGDTVTLSWGPTLKDIPAGDYVARVSDGRGCSATDEITITEPEEIRVDNFVGNECSATVNITPDGQYTFNWNRLDSINGEQKENTVATTAENIVFGLSQGKYYVKARNLDGCTGKTEDIGIIEGRKEAKTFGIHFAYKNPDEEPKKPEPVVQSVTEVVADMKVSIMNSVSSCKAAIEGNIDEQFENLCFNVNNLSDAMEVEYNIPYYHYTLYYYDRANNLTKTVPPEGVTILGQQEIRQIADRRSGVEGTYPELEHTYETKYDYNGLGQLARQETPDAGKSQFIYDNKSRLRFSQNAHQYAEAKYSYTKYDELGRIIEVGQSETGLFNGLQEHADSAKYPAEYCTDLTMTRYTSPAAGINYYGKTQRYLNNRVSYVFSDVDGDTLTKHDQSSTYYSYDPHGNVEWLVQDIPGLGKNYISYTYDLISGNVLEVAFNEYRNDKFFHRYEYDEDNRLLAVKTSADKVLWDNDASYSYYAHGPLRRMEVGEDKVQGIDYTYTIQGWLKAINHATLDANNDPGRDAAGAGGFARDVFGMSLGYYKGDFKRTSDGTSLLFNTNNIEGTRDLYNGNISSWAAQNKTSEEDSESEFKDRMTAQVFTYDKLNRIKTSSFFHDNSGWKGTQKFNTGYTYDKNGNLLQLSRYGSTEGQEIDNLEYGYHEKSNKLAYVNDLASFNGNGEYGDLASDPGTKRSHSYQYDEIGNLVVDEGFEKALTKDGNYELQDVRTEIDWNVYGKIQKVTVMRKTVGATKYDTTTIAYTYGADGNRIKKEVSERNNKPENQVTTFYVRDASGNIMGTYKRENHKVEDSDDTYRALFTMSEQPIYGSSRLGVRTSKDTLHSEKFTKGENRLMEITSKPDQGRAGLFNWITPTLGKVSISENEEICNCQVRNVNFSSNTFSSTQNAATFMGHAKNNVAIAEDFNGKLLFYSVVADDYFGNKNVCLVYDNQGVLMKNSHNIKSSAKAKPMVIKAQGENSRYYLVTIGTDHKPYYHIVDMAQKGYGKDYSAGAVSTKNIPMDNGSFMNYGYHMSAIEDNNRNQSLVYMTRYSEPLTPGTEGRTELVVFDFVPNQAVAPKPELVTSVAGFDKYGEGELQLSPAGNRLAYYNRKHGIAGFAHQEAELHVFGLGRDRKSIDFNDTLSVQGSSAGTAGKASIEFAGNNQLLFTQDGLYLNNETHSERAIWSYRFDTRELSMLPVTTTGDIRRGLDEKIYLAPREADNKLYTLDNLLNKPEVDSTSILHGLGTNYSGITGGLPVQAYRIAPTAKGTYTRSIGYKQYELTDHLGNVRAVVSDSREASYESGQLESTANLLSYNNYYPFGMLQKSRSHSSGEYRFGFQGQEQDNELKGTGNMINYKYRVHDPRLGRFLSIDPLTKDYPWNSPYAFSENRVVDGVELEGAEYLDASGIAFTPKNIGERVILRAPGRNFMSMYPNLGRVFARGGLNPLPTTDPNSEFWSIDYDVKHRYKIKATKYKVHGIYDHKTNKTNNFKHTTNVWKSYSSKSNSVPLKEFTYNTTIGSANSASANASGFVMLVGLMQDRESRLAFSEYSDFADNDYPYVHQVGVLMGVAASMNLIPSEICNDLDAAAEVMNMLLSKEEMYKKGANQQFRNLAKFIYNNREAIFNNESENKELRTGHPFKSANGEWDEGYTDYEYKWEETKE